MCGKNLKKLGKQKAKYGEFQIKEYHETNCSKCDKRFRFRVFPNVDKRFIKFCDRCRSNNRAINYELDFIGSVY